MGRELWAQSSGARRSLRPCQSAHDRSQRGRVRRRVSNTTSDLDPILVGTSPRRRRGLSAGRIEAVGSGVLLARWGVGALVIGPCPSQDAVFGELALEGGRMRGWGD